MYVKAIVIHSYGTEEEFVLVDLPEPNLEDQQVVVELFATSINPIDWKLREGHLKEMLPFEFPIILGWDAAGIVHKVGNEVTDWKPGDRVFARPATTARGTYAEFTAIDQGLLARVPDDVSFTEAAATPLAGLTAWQCLFDFAKLQAGEKVLIHAGAGGVGSFAIQLAKNAGAIVYATGGPESLSIMKKLGADQVVNYKNPTEEPLPADFDVILDTVGGKTQEQSFDLLKEGGRLVSIVQAPNEEKAKGKNVRAGFVWLEPRGDQLQQMAQLMDENKVNPLIDKVLPFSVEGLKEAHRLSQSGHAKGKIVIEMKPEI
jgi:NADPH:quinone reductase-like Zn-dependent oxidoreductase